MPSDVTTTPGFVGTRRPRDFFVKLGTGTGAGAHGRVGRDSRIDIEFREGPTEESNEDVMEEIRSA